MPRISTRIFGFLFCASRIPTIPLGKAAIQGNVTVLNSLLSQCLPRATAELALVWAARFGHPSASSL